MDTIKTLADQAVRIQQLEAQLADVKRVPMTEDQINTFIRLQFGYPLEEARRQGVKFARTIESFHGITQG